MKLLQPNHVGSRTIRGISLVECIIYIALLSSLLAGFISYTYNIQLRNTNLIYEIEDTYHK